MQWSKKEIHAPTTSGHERREEEERAAISTAAIRVVREVPDGVGVRKWERGARCLPFLLCAPIRQRTTQQASWPFAPAEDTQLLKKRSRHNIKDCVVSAEHAKQTAHASRRRPERYRHPGRRESLDI